MIRLVPVLLALLAVSARADQAKNVFDGTAPALEFPKFVPKTPSDLYYFTPQEAAQALKTFGIKIMKESGFTFDRNVPADIHQQMKDDLAFIKTIQASGATPPQEDSAMSTAPATSTSSRRVSAIGMNACGGGNAVACVIPFMDPSKMWLTKNFIKFKHPQVSRMMVVFHESRHTESQNGNWHHDSCPTPFKDKDGSDMKSIWTGALLAGEPACDGTPLGSYGSSTIMLKNIQLHCANCTDKVRMDAGLYADDQLKRVTGKDARKKMEEDFKTKK